MGPGGRQLGFETLAAEGPGPYTAPKVAAHNRAKTKEH